MKNWHKNLILSLLSIVISYGCIEVFIWRNILHYIPLTLHQSLGRLAPLAQKSKKSVRPENYVLLVGDSYAEGLGDRLMQVIRNGNPKFNAAHVLHEITGRDVLSFGYRGGYPSETYVFSTYRSYHGMQLYWGLDIQPPTDVLLFYYEGNDLNDEMTNIRFWLPPSFDKAKVTDQAYVDAYIEERAATGIRASERRWHIFRNAHLFDTATKWLKMSIRNLYRLSDTLLTADDPAFRIGAKYRPNWSRFDSGQTKITIAGKTRNYPSPTVEPFAFYGDQEIKAGMVFFKASVKKVKHLFPNARIRVLYIPTPLMSYRLMSPVVKLKDRIRFAGSEQAGPVTEFSRDHVYARSNQLCKSVENTALEAGVMFADSRIFLQNASYKKGYLHGPNDAGHFNWRGYQALGEVIANMIRTRENFRCARIGL